MPSVAQSARPSIWYIALLLADTRAVCPPGQAIRLVQSAEEWLELWWISSQSKHSPEALERLGFLAFKADTWHLLIGWLCRLAKNTSVEVRGGRAEGGTHWRSQSLCSMLVHTLVSSKRRPLPSLLVGAHRHHVVPAAHRGGGRAAGDSAAGAGALADGAAAAAGP